MAPFESTDHGFISSSDDIEEGTTNQFFTQARARESFSITNTTSSTYSGVTYIFGGLNLTDGIITYIPPAPVNLSPYAPLASPALTGTPTVGGTAIKVNVGDGALTEKNFTTDLNTKLTGIADNADVTPTWVPTSNPNYVTSAQAPLETPVIATPSGTGNLTLTSNTGVNTQLTFTPPAPYTAPYFIFNKSSSQTIPDSGGAVDSVDITWDGLYTASPLTAVAFVSGSATEFKVGVGGMYHLDITAEIGGTGAAKLELNVYIDGVLKVQDIINVYDAQSATTSGDNVRESTLSCSFLKALTTSNVIKVQARAILLVTGTTMVVVAGSTTNRTQVSGFRVGA